MKEKEELRMVEVLDEGERKVEEIVVWRALVFLSLSLKKKGRSKRVSHIGICTDHLRRAVMEEKKNDTKKKKNEKKNEG